MESTAIKRPSVKRHHGVKAVLAIVALLFHHGSARGDKESMSTAARAERPVIYQLVVRHFGNETNANVPNAPLDTNGVGKFDDIDDAALKALKGFNVTHIWLTGVLRQATSTDYAAQGLPADDPDVVKGRAGSFYAVRDLFDVSPDYARDPARRREEFKALVDRIHAHGLKVMIDLVPNHVARGYASIVRPDLDPGAGDDPTVPVKLENGFFYLPASEGVPLRLPPRAPGRGAPGTDGLFALESGQGRDRVRATGNRLVSATPDAASWYDTVVLNYGFDFGSGRMLYPAPATMPVNRTWTLMDEFVRTWTADFGIDGFRVDFAHWVPADFWRWLISRTRARTPGTLFVAEAYENLEGLLAAGFDAVYDDTTYDLVKGVTNETARPADVESHWFSMRSWQPRALRYLENHDERRLASPLVKGSVPDASGFGGAEMARLVGPIVYLSGQGPLLVYNGQTEGERGEGAEGYDEDNGRTSLFDYWTVPALAGWRNGGRYDGRGLSPEARALQDYYRGLLALAREPLFARGENFGLNWVNRDNPAFPAESAYAFARYLPESKRLAVVVGQWRGEATRVRIDLPEDLLRAAGWEPGADVTLEDEGRLASGTRASFPGRWTGSSVRFELTLPARTARVLTLE